MWALRNVFLALLRFRKFWGFLGPKMVICSKILKNNAHNLQTDEI